jgi:hypothetical protein
MSWTVTAHAVMPACARAASAWPGVAAVKLVPLGPGTGRLAPSRPPGARFAALAEWPSDPGRDALCTLTSPLRWFPRR